MKKFDVVICGAGPAGLTASIYVARAGFSVAIIEKNACGGQIAFTSSIDNYPAFTTISGMELGEKMMQHAQSFGVEIIYDEITEIELNSATKVVSTAYSGKIESSVIIIAFGASPRKMDLSNEDKYVGKGVSYCATCDGAFYKNKNVAVVGGGNTAVEDAIYLTNFAKKVYIIHRREQFRASKMLVEKLATSGIQTILDSIVTEIGGEPKLTFANVQNVKTKNITKLELDGLFVAVGQLPQSSLLKDKIALNDAGYVIVDNKMQTNVAGVFSCGDVNDKVLRQVVTACGDGAVAGEMASMYLNLNKA
ncbi:MAG: thioredoxin-disulfide reductase [Clostridia bacterium]